MELRWVDALREHGAGYAQCKADLEQLKRDLYQDLARTNPEKPYMVAELQGQIKCLDNLLQAITAKERKEQVDARRQSTIEQRAAGKLRSVRSS